MGGGTAHQGFHIRYRTGGTVFHDTDGAAVPAALTQVVADPQDGPVKVGEQVLLLQHVYYQQDYGGDADVYQHPFQGQGVVAHLPELIDRGGHGGGFAGGIVGDHAGGTIFAQGTGKGQHRTGQNALAAVGHTDVPKNIGIGQAQGLSGVGQRLVKGLKGTTDRAVHQREYHHHGGKDGGPPGHDQPDAEDLQHPGADETLRPQHPQQQIAHHRRRQHQGQGQYYIQNAFDQTRELGNIIRRGDAREEHHHRRNSGDAQRV